MLVSIICLCMYASIYLSSTYHPLSLYHVCHLSIWPSFHHSSIHLPTYLPTHPSISLCLYFIWKTSKHNQTFTSTFLTVKFLIASLTTWNVVDSFILILCVCKEYCMVSIWMNQLSERKSLPKSLSKWINKQHNISINLCNPLFLMTRNASIYFFPQVVCL